MSNSLLSKRSSLISRRNVIIYIIATILILGIVAGFTNVFHTDNRRFAAKWGETIVMESQPPTTGSPADYDLLSNLQYTAYKIHHAKYFKGYTDGKVSADIGVGNYTQYLTNTRVVYDQNIVFTETISTSSLKSLAEQKYIDNGVIIYRDAKVDGKKVTFSKTASQMSYEQYSRNYGAVPNQLSKYIINKNTILSVKDENASTAPRLNSNGSDDADVSFDVPESLVPDADGNYVFTLTLDPTESSLYYRNEVRTLGGADQNPKFYSVKITVTVDSQWNPISTRTLEEYDIEIPVLGAMRCSGDNLETFTMIDDENGEIPEKDFFQPYVDQAKAHPDYKPPEIDQSGPLSASDYLAAAFADYLSGEKNLDLTADININGIPLLGDLSAYDLNLSVNLDTLDIQAMLGNGLYVKYAGDKVYVKNNDINGYVSTEDAKKLTEDPLLKGLLSFGELDTNKIFGGDMLDVIFKDCEMTEEDGITEIPMSFSLDLSDIIPALNNVQVVASIFINSEDKSLDSITGNVTIGDTIIEINVEPLKTSPAFPPLDGAKDLSGLLDFVPDIAATAMQKTYGIDGTLTLNDMTVGLSAYVDRTEGVKAEATLNVAGIDVLVTYVDGTVYATALGVNVRGTIEELPQLLTALLDVTGFNKYEKLFKAMLPSSVNEIAEMLDTVSVNDNSLDLGLNFIGMPINLTLTRADGKLSSLALGVNVDLFGVKADIAADLNISEPALREVIAPETNDALTFADLATLIKQAKPYLDADYYTAEIDGYAEIDGTRNDISGSFALDKLTDNDKNTVGIAATGGLSALGQDITVTYVDGTAYVGINDIKAKLDTADNSFISSIMQLVGLIAGDYEMPEINLTEAMSGAIKSLTMTDGTLNVALNVEGYDIAVAINLKLGNIAVAATINGVNVELNINITAAQKSHAITAPTDANEYMDISALSALASAATQMIEAGGIHTVANVVIGDVTLNAAIDCTIEDGMLKAIVREDSLGLTVILLGDTAYIEVGGIKVSGQLKDINEIMDAVIPNLPDPIRPYIVKMTDIMLGIIPSQDELTTDGKTDITKTIDTIFAMLTSLSIDGEQINIGISRGALSATLCMATDLSYMSGDVTLTFDGIGGPFGDHYQMAFDFSLKGITASNVTVPAVNTAEYVKASDILTAIDCILPLVKQNAFDLGVSATVYGQTITGNVYIDLGEYTLDTIAVKARLDVAGAPVTVSVVNKTLYLDINNGSVRLVQPLSKNAIKDLLAQIDGALPELGLNDKVTSLLNSLNKEISISDILNNITLSPTQNGMALAATFGKTTVNADIVIADNVLSAINVNCNIDGKQMAIALNVQTADGVLCGVQTTNADIMGIGFGLDLTVTPAEKRAVAPDGVYMEISELIPFISPIMDMIDCAQTAKTITVNVSDFVLTVGGKEMAISGVIDMSLDPIAVSVRLTLFYGTDDALAVTVIYENNVVYVEIGKIKLSFNVATDMAVINDAMAKYLPEYLSLKDIGSMMSSISSLIKDIKNIAAADGAEEILGIMFSQDNAYGKSMIVQALDMIRIGKFNDAVTASVIVMDSPFTVTLDVTPIISDGKVDFKLGVAASNLLNLNLTAKLIFSDSPLGAITPTDAANYTPVVEFVNAVINAVNTITAKVPDQVTTDEDGNTTTVSQIAFSVDTFAFDYDIFKILTTVDENGEIVEVQDEAGRPAIVTDEAGNKVVKQHIDVNNIEGNQALKFKYVTTTQTIDGVDTKSSKIFIEAHIKLDIKESDDGVTQSTASKLGFPIKLNLYVAPTEQYPDGLAYLHYEEANGYGEKISLDYNSIMEIVAAALDILSVDDATVESLLGKYRLDIDKTVFESMAIAGLDSIKDLLNNLIKAVDEAKLALGDAKAAWSRMQNAGSIDALIYEMMNDEKSVEGETVTESTIKTLLDSTISHIKAAIALFKTDDGEDDEQNNEDGQINGALFGKVVNAVYFQSANSALSAYVDNAVATGTEGWATVEVASSGDKINSIGVDNLDVNKAKLNTFDMQFTAGQELDITVPTSEFTTDSKTAYSDFANIKHLLFDVMNTANMLEFEIGGLDTDDGISLNLHIGKLQLENVKIKIDAKVKILDNGKDASPRYSTAADIELQIPKMTVLSTAILNGIVLPECTTRLFFYDDVIYIVGRDWQHGTKKDNITRSYNSLINGIYWKTEEVQAAFTVSELGYMMSNDIEKFLNEFVFRLLPLSRCVNSIGDMDVQQTIIDNVTKEDTNNNTQNTLAQIFKSYQYNNGSHDIVIGLAELAGSTALSDVSLSLIGANDGDKNILDNYIQRLTLATSMVGLIDVSMDVSLRNVSTPTVYYTDKALKQPSPNNIATEFKRQELESTGLSSTTINGTKYTIDGSTATVYSNRTPTGKDSDVKSLINTILANVTRDKAGKITAVINREGGIQWTRPWQAAYEASLAA